MPTDSTTKVKKSFVYFYLFNGNSVYTCYTQKITYNIKISQLLSSAVNISFTLSNKVPNETG